MAATFVVESGTGLSDANAYCSVAFADQYIENFGNSSTWSSSSTADKQKHIRFATRAIDMRYADSFLGYRKTEDQALDWPRWDSEDVDGYLADSNAVPVEVQRATAYLALQSAAGDDLYPDLSADDSGRIMSRSISGPGGSESITYAGPRSPIKVYAVAEGIMRRILGGYGNSFPLYRS
tara:strand:- start:1941 stop:2477 length:537 start_codon:yes stop_codon:yes gene_type:complete